MTTQQNLRKDLTPAEREQAERIGRIEFKSAGAKRTPEQKERAKATRLARKVAKFERHRAEFARMVEMKLKFRSRPSAPSLPAITSLADFAASPHSA
jgi:ABC-type phosphate transport system auxiliary subunit